MDPGLQIYGGTHFRQIRDKGDAVFLSLPAPQPATAARRMAARATIVATAGTGGPPQWGASGGATRAAPTYVPPVSSGPDMRTYYAGSGGGCFSGASTVAVVDPAASTTATITPLAEVKAGMLVQVANTDGASSNAMAAKVVCVVKIARDSHKPLCFLPESGLEITGKHPVRIQGVWQQPSKIPGATTIPTGVAGCVYNVVLDSNHVLLVNGVECITWGHNFTATDSGDNKAVAHPYYGSQQVVKDLAKMSGWESGLVNVDGCFKEAATGAVVRLFSSGRASN